jgi:hypothetical protein
MSKFCQNCGREHTGKLIETFTDGDGKDIDIVVCEHPRFDTYITLDKFWRYYV